MGKTSEIKQSSYVNGIIIYFTCAVCFGSYTKMGAHSECYKRYCGICERAYKTKEFFKDHALKYHKLNFCEKCHTTFDDTFDENGIKRDAIKNHNKHHHKEK